LSRRYDNFFKKILKLTARRVVWKDLELAVDFPFEYVYRLE
jgi:hypothetical protein